MTSVADDNRQVVVDRLTAELADYAAAPAKCSAEAVDTARLCLMDSVGCALAALSHPLCVAHLGPLLPGATHHGGARVLGTGAQLDPVKATFDNGAMIRWLDFNDTWLAEEWGHPSDNLAALLALADYRCRNPGLLGGPVTVGELLSLAVQAHEIQGVLALGNSFNRVGLDHVLLVKLVCAALSARLADGGRTAVESAISHAWIDGHALRAYRHAPNASQRKSWAAGDAAARGVRLGLMAARCNLPVLRTALGAPRWGFADVCLTGKIPVLQRPLGCYVMENILFKVQYPAEFHAQTAVECAVKLHQQIAGKTGQISAVRIETQESALRIISKTGELRNYADRDHCIQHMVGVALLEGILRAEHYADDYPRRAEVDALRAKMTVVENPEYTRDYLDPAKRSIANAVTVELDSSGGTARVAVEYPLGHRRRRAEARPLIFAKFAANARPHLGARRTEELVSLFADAARLDGTTVAELVDLTCL